MKKCPSNKNSRGIVRLWRTVLLFLLPTLAGCSHLTSEIGPPLPVTPAITTGQSTLGDVLKSIGVPSQISASPAGFIFLYEHNGVTENQLGLSVNYPVLDWFKFVYAHSRLNHEAWLLAFDTNGVLQAWGEENWEKPLGQGAAIQILITAQSLVDSSQVRRPAAQHEWGEMWLNPLPEVLNTSQSPKDGRFGLEQTLAPTAVGQHALEMIQPLLPKQQSKQLKQ